MWNLFGKGIPFVVKGPSEVLERRLNFWVHSLDEELVYKCEEGLRQLF